MTETLVRAQKTILQAKDVYDALHDAYLSLIGSEPGRPQLLMMLAQCWLETGAGNMSFGYNLGGIKHVTGDGHDYYQIQTHEVIGGVDKVLVQPFRSYASLKDAATDFVHLLRTTFGFAWPYIESADIPAYAHALRQRNYFTADEHDYAAGLAIRFKQLDAEIPQAAPVQPIQVATEQPTPGTDADSQPTPPGDLPPPDDAA